jgi:hypothetical protein
MKRLFSALILGIAIAFTADLAFTASAAFAEEAQTTQAGAANTPAKKTRAVATVLASGQYASEAEAKAACAGDAVVWANIGTKVYHHAGAGKYGKTKRGAYMCEKDTAAAGFRAAKNEKRK